MIGASLGVPARVSSAFVVPRLIDSAASSETVVASATPITGLSEGVPAKVSKAFVVPRLIDSDAAGEMAANGATPIVLVVGLPIAKAISPARAARSCWIWGSGMNLLILDHHHRRCDPDRRGGSIDDLRVRGRRIHDHDGRDDGCAHGASKPLPVRYCTWAVSIWPLEPRSPIRA